MQKNPASQSGFFNPRVLLAFALCSVGIFLGMFSLAETTRPNTSVPPDRANFPRTSKTESVSLASGAASDWSIVNSPNRRTPTHNLHSGITCVSASDCWAVGYYDNISAFRTLIEHWDGTSWTVVTSPNTGATQHNTLKGVTCESASNCWAVGTYIDGSFSKTLIQHWDGISWTIVTSPNTSGIYHQLLDVACASASDCWAVGFSAHPTTGHNQTLIERWNGTSWAIVNSPNTLSTEDNYLYGMACASASDCWAVGFSVNPTSGKNQTLIERWNGTSWAIVSSPNNNLIAADNELFGVACASASDCWAVGYYLNEITGSRQTLIERWNGTLWAIVSSPNTSTTDDDYLLDVTCPSGSECWAVGSYDNGAVGQTLIEHWNGTSWTIMTSPNTIGQLFDVACASTSECRAVGYYYNGSVEQTLTQRWNGTSWTIVTSPNIDAARNNTPLGMTCVSASDCWAVGSYFEPGFLQTLIERWDGTSWAIVESPNTGEPQNYLYEVTCVSASDCWAVGYYTEAYTGISQTLIERWNGTSWAIVASPNTGASQNNFLTDVTCVSGSECWAVGYYDNGAVYQTLIEHWDGAAWAIVTSPNTSPDRGNRLDGVTCVSASDCWAVGSYSGIVEQTLTQRWNGTSWNIVSSPNTSTTTEANSLSNVTCASASDCWAVGSYGSPSPETRQTLIEHWDGSSWAIVSSPNPTVSGPNYNVLRGVMCASTSECWAVGYYFTDGAYRTLIEHWDGSSWEIVNSPNTSATQDNYIFGVTCVSASDCWAAGYYTDDTGIFQTLTEHYTGSLPPILTSVVSRKTHGSTGTFDIDLPLTGSPGVECRNFQDANSGRHQIVFTFATPVTVNGSQDPKASLTAPKGGSVDTVDVNNSVATANLKDVGDQQTVTLTLLNVSDGTNSGNVVVPIGVLLGDTSADGVVNSADITQTRRQSGNVAHDDPSANFREDVTADGTINSADITAVRRQSGSALPQ